MAHTCCFPFKIDITRFLLLLPFFSLFKLDGEKKENFEFIHLSMWAMLQRFLKMTRGRERERETTKRNEIEIGPIRPNPNKEEEEEEDRSITQHSDQTQIH